MKIHADENLYEPIIAYLRAQGHAVESVRDSGLIGSSDEQVFERAVQTGATIFTMDRDFLRMSRFPPERCGGIVVIKIYRKPLVEVLRIFRQQFESIPEHRILRRLVIVSPVGVRIRHPFGPDGR